MFCRFDGAITEIDFDEFIQEYGLVSCVKCF